MLREGVEVLRHVAVFDGHLPPGLAFIRQLGAFGVPVTVFSPRRLPAGRFSRFKHAFQRCPDPAATDEFTDWLTEEMRAGRVDLVAPTSDAVAFCVAEARDRLPADTAPPGPSRDVIYSVLFKHRFGDAMGRLGFPAPPSAAPVTPDGYREFARQTGFPLVLKPRSHVGVGANRGSVVRDHAELEAAIVPFSIPPGNDTVLREDPDLRWPLIQRYIDTDTSDIVSVSGCLAGDGTLLAVGHSRKTEMWPPQVGVGTEFEWLDSQPFTEQAVSAVRSVIGSGLFELEVCHDRATGQSWPIDLNPRGYGQMSLDIANGNDLPTIWYRSITNQPPAAATAATQPETSARTWRLALPFYVGRIAGIVQGPQRWHATRTFVRNLGSRPAGAVAQHNDPLPAIVYSLSFLRHPWGLVRPFVEAGRHPRSSGRTPQAT